jgi:hypothetical protein
MAEEKQLTDNQKKAKSLLDRLKSMFSKPQKEIDRIRVIAGTQKFWCSNPKKIRYWRGLAHKQATFSLNNDTSINAIRITQVKYK